MTNSNVYSYIESNWCLCFQCPSYGITKLNDLLKCTPQKLFEGLAGVVSIADDILVSGATQKEYDSNVISFLVRCSEVNLKLNANKVKLNCKEIPFFGQCVTSSGIKPNQAKVNAINICQF